MIRKASPVLIHLAAWLLFMTIPLLFMTQGQPLSNLSGSILLPYFQFCLLYISIFYLHTNWLIPVYFLRKKYLVYSLILTLLLVFVFFIKPFDALMKQNRPGERRVNQTTMHRPPPPPAPQGGFSKQPPAHNFNPGAHFDITSIFIFIMIIGLGSALQYMKQWQRFEKRALQAEAEKATAELSFLKAQINPHFLYNTLNNIYTLCLIGSDHAAESILKLSNIMRYVTDESDADFVPLSDEIACISNFIALQKLRLGKKVTLKYEVEGEADNHRISPLLLMTFIENAFKYGLSNHLEASIKISIKIAQQKIYFSAENQIFEHQERQQRKGIGIDNTKKRLDYLYPNTHSLRIVNEQGWFKVFLILDSK